MVLPDSVNENLSRGYQNRRDHLFSNILKQICRGVRCYTNENDELVPSAKEGKGKQLPACGVRCSRLGDTEGCLAVWRSAAKDVATRGAPVLSSTQERHSSSATF